MNNIPHICGYESCSICQSGAIFPKYQDCPVCCKPLIPKNNLVFGDLEQKIIDKYPYVIAHTFLKMHREGTDPQKKTFLFKDVINGTLKHIALLVATEYFESPLKSDQINELFEKNLRRHTLGQLHLFIRASLKELILAGHSFFMPEIPVFYEKIQSSKRSKTYSIMTEVTDESGMVQQLKEKMSAIDALINFRNREIGHGLIWTNEKYKSIIDVYYPILLDLLHAMDFVTLYPMYKWNKGGKWSLMGSTIKTFKKESIPPKRSEHLWIENPEKNKIHLLPFFIIPNNFISNHSEKVELFVYEDYTGNRIIYLSPENERGITSGKTVKLLNDKIESKLIKNLYSENELSREQLISTVKKINKSTISTLEKEGKILKNIYQSRIKLEKEILLWKESSFSLFFINATAGSGKTNLLVEINKQYENNGVTSLLLRAGREELNSLDDVLKLNLDLTPDFNFNYFIKLGFSRKNPFILLIDGGNEHNNPTDFINSVLNYGERFSGGFIKIVITWRSDVPQDLPILSDKYKDLFYAVESDPNHVNLLAQKAFNLEPFNQTELEGAWRLYTKGPKKFKIKFSFEELTYYDRNLQEELANPLKMRYFFDIFNNNKSLPKDKNNFNIWENYLRNISPEEQEFILLLINIMFHQDTNILTMSSLYEQKTIKDFLYDNDIKGPYQQLILKGIITEYYFNNEFCLSFTMEAFYHFLLGKVLTITSSKSLKQIWNTKKIKGLSEGIEHCLMNFARTSNLKGIIDFVDDATVLLCINPIILGYKLFTPKKILEELYKNPTVEVLNVIQHTIYNLKNSDKHLLVKEIFKTINEIHNLESIESLALVIDSIEYIEKADRITQLEVIVKKLKSFNMNTMDGHIIYNRIGFQFEHLAEPNRALHYYEKGLIVLKENFKDDFNSFSESYNSIGRILLDFGKHIKAIELFTKALECSKIPYVDPINVATYLNNLGLAHLNNSEFEKALNFYNKAYEMDLKILGQYHSRSATTLMNIGLANKMLGNYEVAKLNYNKSLKVHLKTFGENHLSIAITYSNLGSIEKISNNYDLALDFFNKALNIRLSLLGKIHPDISKSYNDIGCLYKDKAEYSQALKFLERALEINKCLREPDSYQYLSTLSNIGNIWFLKEDFNKAYIYYNKAYNLLDKDKIYDRSTIANNIGMALEGQKKNLIASKYYLESYKGRLSILGSNHPLTLQSSYDVAKILLKQRKEKEANAYLENWWMNSLEKKGGPAYELFQCYSVLHNTKEALKWLEEAALIRKERLGIDDKLTIQTIEELILFAKKSNNFEVAEKWQQRI